MPKKKARAAGEDAMELQEGLEELMGDLQEASRDIGELHSDVEEIKKSQQSLLKRVSSRLIPEEFAWDDLAQQVVGAMILSTPLAVTQEVWMLAQNLDPARVITILLITMVFNVLLIYHTKYQVVKEQKILAFIPLRLFSQLVVSYASALTMLYVFGIIGGQVTALLDVIKLVIFVGLFANIGAGTADLLK